MPPVLRRNDEASTLELDLSGARGGEFKDALAKIKEIPGRRYDGQRKIWSVPLNPDVAHRVVATIDGLKTPDGLVDWIREERTKKVDELTTPLPADAKLMLPWANKRMSWQPEVINDEPFDGLLEYQRAAVDKMVTERKVILADDMGLGKTAEAMAAIEEAYLRDEVTSRDGTVDAGPKLVICPKSVMGSWERQLKLFLGPDTKVTLLTQTTPAARHKALVQGVEEDAWVIVNWEQITIQKTKKRTRNGGSRTVKHLKDTLLETAPWFAIIADEAHKAKNYQALRTQGLWRLQAPIMFALTGTPVQNSPDELWPLLRWLWPEQYNSNGKGTAYWSFYHMYVDAWEDPYGHKVIIGVKNPDALRFEIKDRLIRRTIGQVRSTPGRRRIYLPLEMGKYQRDLYDSAESEMWVEIEKAAAEGDKIAQEALGNPLVLIKNGAVRTLRLRQVLETPALLGGDDHSIILDDLCERVWDTRPNQWIVFTAFKATGEAIEDRLSKLNVGLWNGDVNQEARTELENRFQCGDIDVLVGTIDSMREGVTLTAAHLEYFVSRAWVPDWNEQAEARAADRLGQQNKTMIYVPQVTRSVATSHVDPANRKKEGIVRTILKKDHIEEERG